MGLNKNIINEIQKKIDTNVGAIKQSVDSVRESQKAVEGQIGKIGDSQADVRGQI